MKNASLAVAVVLTCLFQGTSLSHAQGTTYLTGLDRLPAGSLAIGADAWSASWFQAGSNPGGYVLNSIELAMGQPVGSPAGLTIAIWDFRAHQPICVLAGPEPSSAGVFTYTASNFSLSPRGVYWFVIKSSTPSAIGEFHWNYSTLGLTHFELWSGGGYQSSPDGLLWTRDPSITPQFAVNATPVPEPGVPALLGIGVGLLWAARRRRAQRGEPSESRAP